MTIFSTKWLFQFISQREEEQGFAAASRSYREEDLSLALVRITISDVNDNVPLFMNNPYLSGRSKI